MGQGLTPDPGANEALPVTADIVDDRMHHPAYLQDEEDKDEVVLLDDAQEGKTSDLHQASMLPQLPNKEQYQQQ